MSNPCNQMDFCHQAPLSAGFSRQEYWGGLPCPPPGELPDPGIKPGSPILQVDSLPAEPQGKLMAGVGRIPTGGGSLSLLQRIFLTRNWTGGLLHCRQILYQLSYQEDLTEAEDIKKWWQEYTEELYKKDLHELDKHNDVITYLEPDILVCGVKWAFGSYYTQI